MPRIVQMPMRLCRRQPFVPQMHRNPELHSQLLRKRLRLCGLWALIPRHIQRIPHHSLRHSMFPQHPSHRLQICSPPRPMQRKQRLRRIPQWVRDRQPNPPVPHIQPQNPSHQHTLTLLRLPSLQHLRSGRILPHRLSLTASRKIVATRMHGKQRIDHAKHSLPKPEALL